MKLFRLLGVICLAGAFYNALGQVSSTPTLQPKKDTIRVSVTRVGDDFIPWVALPEVVIKDVRIFNNPEDRVRFYRLKRDVLKVMPYAIFARNRYAQLQRDLALISSKKDQRKLVKECNHEIKEMFNREIKQLTMTQGGILIKLIDREIGKSSFEILKDMRGGFTAFLYQSVAKVFSNDLKSRYDVEEDRDIEAIIQSSNYKME